MIAIPMIGFAGLIFYLECHFLLIYLISSPEAGIDCTSVRPMEPSAQLGTNDKRRRQTPPHAQVFAAC